MDRNDFSLDRLPCLAPVSAADRWRSPAENVERIFKNWLGRLINFPTASAERSQCEHSGVGIRSCARAVWRTQAPAPQRPRPTAQVQPSQDRPRRSAEDRATASQRSSHQSHSTKRVRFGAGQFDPLSTSSIRGATRLCLGLEREKVRCTWTRDFPGALWTGDFSHGPIVLVDGKPCQTHLSAWIDSHSRYVVDARYYLRENLDILIDSLLRAWAKHGSPRELYADNGKVYHANGLVIACAQLQIAKLHRPPREPEPGGLIERFFLTVQSQLGAEVQAMSTLTLEQLNQAFEAWLQSAYHCEVHSVTNQTPNHRYFTEQRIVRPVSITEVESCFYRREQRRVDPTYSDVSIDRRFYKVDRKLRRMQLEVQFNPFRTDPQQPDEVKLYSLEGIYLGVAPRYQRERGADPPGESVEPKPLLNSPYIDALLKEHQRAHEQARQGIDYKTAMQHGRLNMAQFGGQFSHYLGRSGLSSLSATELSALESFYAKYPQVRSWQVQRAFELAAGGGFASTLWHLQSLLDGSTGENPTGNSTGNSTEPSAAPDNER